jgi:hypothetical protein
VDTRRQGIITIDIVDVLSLSRGHVFLARRLTQFGAQPGPAQVDFQVVDERLRASAPGPHSGFPSKDGFDRKRPPAARRLGTAAPKLRCQIVSEKPQ